MTDTDEAVIQTAAAATAHMIHVYAQVRGIDPRTVKSAIDGDHALFDMAMQWADVPSKVERVAESLAQAQGIDSGTLLMNNAGGAFEAVGEARHMMAVSMMARIHQLAPED